MRVTAGIRGAFALLALFLSCAFSATAADTLRVLFIGNSYTATHNLPQVFKDMAASTGQVVITDEHTPGGYTFQQHSANATTQNKVSAGNWDYVVLQEQSQYPSFPDGQVATGVFPYARFLDSLAKAKNPCAQTVFYMTWGRKEGDAGNCPGWPPVCTYEGMDSLLRLRYIQMAEANGAVLSPAGAVWRYLRSTTPGIELYAADQSHPAFAGTYAAACAFYAALLRKDPTHITYTGSLSATVAQQIRAAAKTVVYDSLEFWRQYVSDPQAAFTPAGTGSEFSFTNGSVHADNYQWFFGDGAVAAIENPTHTYTANGTYEVMLVASRCQLRDTARQTIVVTGGTGVGMELQAHEITVVQQGAVLWLQSARPLAADARVFLYNMAGQQVGQQQWPAAVGRIALDIAALPQGIYTAVLQGKDGSRQRVKLHLQ